MTGHHHSSSPVVWQNTFEAIIQLQDRWDFLRKRWVSPKEHPKHNRRQQRASGQHSYILGKASELRPYKRWPRVAQKSQLHSPLWERDANSAIGTLHLQAGWKHSTSNSVEAWTMANLPENDSTAKWQSKRSWSRPWVTCKHTVTRPNGSFVSKKKV